jgi:hypothetical protein
MKVALVTALAGLPWSKRIRDLMEGAVGLQTQTAASKSKLQCFPWAQALSSWQWSRGVWQ